MSQKEAIIMLRERLELFGAAHPPKQPIEIPDADPGIYYALTVLRAAGVETYESCQAGEGHSYKEPAVRFFGDATEGYRVVSTCLAHGLPLRELRRVWRVDTPSQELNGPQWEVVFSRSPVVPKGTPDGWETE